MKKIIVLIYGILWYIIFLISFLYAIGFVGNFWVPKGIDSGTETNFMAAIGANVALLSLFAIHLNVMARPAFKERWVKNMGIIKKKCPCLYHLPKFRNNNQHKAHTYENITF